MISRLFKKRSAKFQIALGQVGFLLSILMAASFLGLVPDAAQMQRETRALLAETIAINSSVFITRADIRRMETNLRVTIDRNEEILSAAVRPKSGKALVIVGDHEANWHSLGEQMTDETQVSVPIWEGKRRWGNLELRFEPIVRPGWAGLLDRSLLLLLVFACVLSFIAFYFYLGKMLKHLDPSKAIPDRVRSALDTMAEGLLVLDAKQNIVLANQAFSLLVGKTPDQLMGQNVASFDWENADNDTIEVAQSPWARALQHGMAQMGHVVRLPLATDEQRSFMTNCSPVMGGNGKVAGVLISFDDVTELERKELELKKSKAEAEMANRTKSEFLANMSHEIRTPMNAILGFTEVLKRGYGKNKQDSAKYLNTIASSGEHLLGLINDILDLSKVEAGAVEVERVPVGVHHQIREVINIMRVKAEKKGIFLAYKPEGELPEIIQTDPAKLRQMLTNLIGNAIKFTEQGGISVITRLSMGSAEPVLIIDVVDSGIGMSQEQAAGVFRPFVQADSSITRRFGGTGLGLTISKRFAEALGGDISVQSEAGKGSTFSIKISAGNLAGVRLLGAAEILSDQQDAVTAENTRWKFPAARVLVVDDGDENRSLLEVVLSDVGLQVDTAVNGKEGADKVLAGDYALVLMDVQMPVMDGYTAVALLREKGVTIPIIALTAHAMKGVETQCLAAGYSGYMAKPINIDQLLNSLAEELDGKAVVAQPANEALELYSDDNSEGDDALASAQGYTQVVLAIDTEVLPATREAPLKSSLPMSNPKFREIVEKFKLRLKTQLQAIEAAWNSRDYTRLADLAHWLKGSAGSVGFDAFTPLAKNLETLVNNKAQTGIDELLQQLAALYQRIELGDGSGVAEDCESGVEKKVYAMPAVVTSRLPMQKDKFHKIVVAFVNRLDSQVRAIQLAADKKQYHELAELAHWLKGSAGSVGFDVFFEPARDLEQHSQQRDDKRVKQAVAAIAELNRRIVVVEQGIGADGI